MLKVNKMENANIPQLEGYTTIVHECSKCKNDSCKNEKAIEKGYCYCFLKNNQK